MLSRVRGSTTKRDRSPAQESGAAAVEFALVLPVLLLLVFGIIQYGYYFFAAQQGTSALRETARQISVGNCVDFENDPTDDSLATGYLTERLNNVVASDLALTLAYSTDPADPGVGDEATLTMSFNTLNMNIPFLPVPGDATVLREANVRIEDLSSEGC